MSETTHQGGCHCGAVRYQVALDLEKPALTCNCSICSKLGTMLSFVPPDKFTLERGTAELTDYQFNKHNIHHLFCNKCGVKSFARGTGPDGKPMVAINVRCLDNVDLDKVPTTMFDGRKL
ncbi:MAG: GFA family protein [Deltaproteobacteria bacterium]|nr:GFA family protein [Deltaproteobacteria bacterium]MDQ3299181.1 GFA family protein [Myxococcota bacterium]